MVSQKVTIKNPTGLHLRPAGILCKEAMKFKSLITFRFAGGSTNKKSVLNIYTLDNVSVFTRDSII